MAEETINKRIVVGVSGASGAPYARRLVSCLIEANVEVHLAVTPNGRRLFHDELDLSEINSQSLLGFDAPQLIMHAHQDVGSSIASGSMHTDGMIICPCSSHTLGSIASGLGGNVLTRAAQVTLKERRRLVVVLREMPMGQLDLENALRLSQAGAVICPASPGFYMLPETVGDVVDFVVGKLLDLINVPHCLHTRWTDMLKLSESEKRKDS
ncbi:MAG: UbiX family flavin prenyltransferase [Planctomycetes bacterium]|nr:UbiX family flavin prenyltransferase [Planctomycetota bacterium]